MTVRAIRVFCFLLFCSTGLAFAQEEVDLNALDPAPAAPVMPAPRVVVNLYADFDVLWTFVGNDPWVYPALAYSQNHRSVLLEGAFKDRVKFAMDVFNPNSYLEMTLFNGPHSLRFGMILLPFGEFNFHHIYGGIEDEQAVFLPKLWSDLGLAYKLRLPENLSVEFYTVNGFATTNGGREPDFHSMGGSTGRWQKALGFQGRWDPIPGTFLTVSAYDDPFDTKSTQGRNTFLGGLDGATRWGAWTAKAGFLWGQISTQDAGGAALTYQRWGDYAEVKWTLTPQFDLRARIGRLDPDSRLVDDSDLGGGSLAGLWHFDVLDVNLVYQRVQPLWTQGLAQNQVFLKLLVAL